MRAVVVVLVLAEASALTRLSWDSAKPVLSANELYNRTDCEAELLLLVLRPA